MTTCDYCLHEIKGRPFYFHRWRFDIMRTIPDDFDMKQYNEDMRKSRKNVCRDCLQDMGIRIAV